MTVAPISPPTCCLVCTLKVHIYVATSTRYTFWLSRISTVFFFRPANPAWDGGRSSSCGFWNLYGWYYIVHECCPNVRIILHRYFFVPSYWPLYRVLQSVRYINHSSLYLCFEQQRGFIFFESLGRSGLVCSFPSTVLEHQFKMAWIGLSKQFILFPSSTRSIFIASRTLVTSRGCSWSLGKTLTFVLVWWFWRGSKFRSTGVSHDPFFKVYFF